MVRNLLSRDRTATADAATVDNATAVDQRQTRAIRTREPVTDPTVAEPTREAASRWVRTSTFATLGLIIGLGALFATFTGLLAALGVALGVIGGAVSAGGVVGASRRGVTGHSVALLGLVFSLVAIALGILAISGDLTWLNSRTDEVARLRDWLDIHISWFKHW